MFNTIKNIVLFFLAAGLAVASFIFSGRAEQTVSYSGIAAGFVSIAVFIIFMNGIFKSGKKANAPEAPGGGSTGENENISGEPKDGPASGGLPKANENENNDKI